MVGIRTGTTMKFDFLLRCKLKKTTSSSTKKPDLGKFRLNSCPKHSNGPRSVQNLRFRNLHSNGIETMVGLRLALIEGRHSQELYSVGDVTVMVALSPNLRRGADAEVFPLFPELRI